jgi:hypothetical protein
MQRWRNPLKIKFANRLAMTAAAMVLSASPATAEVTLLGDTLSFLRTYPTPTTPFTQWNPVQVSTTVTADASDTINWNAGNAPITINPGADQIVFTFLTTTSYVSSGGVFDGFVITGFSHDIVSASVLSQTIPGLVVLDVSARQLNLGIDSGTLAGQNVVLQVSAVPESGIWALMLGGMTALGAFVRRRPAAAA